MTISKTEQSEQICRIGTPAGFGSVDPPALTRFAIAPLADEYGRLIVVTDGPSGASTARFFSTGGNRVTQEYIGNPFQAKKVIQVAGYNADPVNDLFVQIHEENFFPILNGAVPVVVIPVPKGFSTFSYGLTVSVTDPLNFLIVAISTTELTFTAPPNDFLWFSAMYFT
jgi:hypothetical protein